MRSLFFTILWGEDYVRNFTSVSLPTLLAPRNLGSADENQGSKFLIVTTARDAEKIRLTPAFALLKKRIQTQFLIITAPRGRDKYRAVSTLQMKVIHLAADYEALFFLYPDFIYSDGAIGNTLKRLAKGHDGVVLPVPRVNESTMVPELSQCARDGIVSLPPRSFVRLADANMHSTMASYVWGNREFSGYPSTLLWRGPDGGLLFRCFHLHPLALRVQASNPGFTTPFKVTLDEEYLPRLFSSPESLYCVADSDEIAVCSLAADNFRVSRIDPWDVPDTTFIARWAEVSASVLHRGFVRRCYRWHSGDMDEGKWRLIEALSADKIAQILDRLQIPGEVLRIEDYPAYLARQRRVRRFRYWGRPTSSASLKLSFIPMLHLIYLLAAHVTLRVLELGRRMIGVSVVAQRVEGLMLPHATGRLQKLRRQSKGNSMRAILMEVLFRRWWNAIKGKEYFIE